MRKIGFVDSGGYKYFSSLLGTYTCHISSQGKAISLIIIIDNYFIYVHSTPHK